MDFWRKKGQYTPNFLKEYNFDPPTIDPVFLVWRTAVFHVSTDGIPSLSPVVSRLRALSTARLLE